MTGAEDNVGAMSRIRKRYDRLVAERAAKHNARHAGSDSAESQATAEEVTEKTQAFARAFVDEQANNPFAGRPVVTLEEMVRPLFERIAELQALKISAGVVIAKLRQGPLLSSELIKYADFLQSAVDQDQVEVSDAE